MNTTQPTVGQNVRVRLASGDTLPGVIEAVNEFEEAAIGVAGTTTGRDYSVRYEGTHGEIVRRFPVERLVLA